MQMKMALVLSGLKRK